MDARDDRERDLAAREAEVERRETALAAMAETIEQVLHHAAQRDEDADHRDDVAVERDRAASLDAFTAQAGPYLHDLQARREAAINRHESKDDREAAADDRDAMTPVKDLEEHPHGPE